MADGAGHKQEFLIRNLPTRQVTLYPTTAQITRDINEVTLQPGANEITIYGITPTADESSIKVDGRGGATITDMMVDLVPNKEAFEDVYPEDEDDEESVITDDADDTESEIGNEETRTLASKISKLDEEIKHIREDKNSATGQFSILEKYKDSVEQSAPNDLAKFIQVYRDERRKVFAFVDESESRLKVKGEQRLEAYTRHRKALQPLRRERAKLNKAKKLEADKKLRADKERKEAKSRLRAERTLFWAKKIFRVIIRLDASIETPASSRRGSIESLATLKQEPIMADPLQISLSISYVSSAASWVPCYDLSLNTSTTAGTIIYRSEYYNATSETWKDAKVSLSTSDAAFQGLGQPSPALGPWSLKLVHDTSAYLADEALFSLEERNYKKENQSVVPAKSSELRAELFGLPDDSQVREMSSNSTNSPTVILADPLMTQITWNAHQLEILMQQNQRQMQQARGAKQGRQKQTARKVEQQPQQAQQGIQQKPQSMETADIAGSKKRRSVNGYEARESAPAGAGFSDFDMADESGLPGALDSLATEEATWAEEGLTFTYDIGVRTIIPSFTQRRYRISSFQLRKINLSYLLVPKLQAAAFLNARIQNSSSVALLRGMAGVTLDGSFLGNTGLPRCNAGESFSLNLGVDPAVHVTYGKPTMKRNKESGLFFTQKEESHLFTRNCTIMNTKSNRAIEGVMLDQVPLSTDERLKIHILEPSDINEENNSKIAGEGITKSGRKDSGWGAATARHQANGEIQWDFKIEPARGGKFVLEYGTRHPSGESLVEGNL